MRTISNLLLDEHPLQVMPKLATLIGLNEAIVLQQIHYWLKHKEKNRQDYIDGHYWVYNTYGQWQEQFPFWSVMTIRRTMTRLENKGLLIAGNYNKAGFDKTKWYTIGYDTLRKMVSTSVQNEHTVCSHCTDAGVQSEQTNTIDYPETTTENTLVKGGTITLDNTYVKNQIPFDWSVLEKQIIKSCYNYGIEDCSDYIIIIKYYYSSYMALFHKEHPHLSTAAMDKVVQSLCCGTELVEGTEPSMYKSMIDQHFKTQYNSCDYNICHFMTEGIRNNRYYETCY